MKALALRAVGADGRPRIGGGVAAQGLQRLCAGGMVGVRVSTHNHTDIAARGLVQTRQVVMVGGAGIDDDIAAFSITHQVAVGAWPCHHARIGRGQAHDVFQQCHGGICLPVKGMHNLPIGAGQSEFAERRFMLHVARHFTSQQAGARAGCPQRLLGRSAGLQDGINIGIGLQALQRANGREDDEKIARLMLDQRISRAYP